MTALIVACVVAAAVLVVAWGRWEANRDTVDRHRARALLEELRNITEDR